MSKICKNYEAINSNWWTLVDKAVGSSKANFPIELTWFQTISWSGLNIFTSTPEQNQCIQNTQSTCLKQKTSYAHHLHHIVSIPPKNNTQHTYLLAPTTSFSLPFRNPTTTATPAVRGPDIAHQGQIIASGELDRFTEGQKPAAVRNGGPKGETTVKRWQIGWIDLFNKCKTFLLHKMLCMCKLVGKFMRGTCLIKWMFIQY